MIKIGVTGGIGSGKSIVCDIFRLHNIPVFDADGEAKVLNDTSPIIREQLIHHFGSHIYDESKLNREKFAALIFNNKENLKISNSIIHPEVENSFIKWCRKQRQHPFVIIESALLIEAGFQQFVDKVIAVYAPKELRIERVMRRNQTNRGEVEARVNNQMPEEQKIKFADFIIYNDNRRSLIRQVADILNELSPG